MRAHAAELLAILRAQPGARVPGLVTATSWSSATVKRVLAFLKQRGDIAFEGAPKNGVYRVIVGESRG